MEGVRLRDGVDFRVRDRVGIRDRIKARCGFGFIGFSLSKLKLMICPCGEKQVHRIESPNITPNSSGLKPPSCSTIYTGMSVLLSSHIPLRGLQISNPLTRSKVMTKKI